jgi:hypothetical protein
LTGDKIPDFFLDFRDFCEIQGLFPTVKSVNRIPGLFPLAWEPWEGQVVFYEEPFTNKTDCHKSFLAKLLSIAEVNCRFIDI